jgi:hypothetical protein
MDAMRFPERATASQAAPVPATRTPVPGRLRGRTIALLAAPAAALVAALLAGGCSRDVSAPGVYSITGHVVLTGYLTDTSGRFAGTRVVGDADGVVVELVYGDAVVARAATVDGVYRFEGMRPGLYIARTRLNGLIHDQTLELTIANYDLTSRDTMKLGSRGDLYPVPNPFTTRTTVYFQLPDTEYVDVRILDLSGRTVRKLLLAERPEGLNQVQWDGVDSADVPVAERIHWITLSAADGERAQLLFR